MKFLKALVLLILFAITATAQSTIKFGTFNVQHGEGTDGATNYQRQVDAIVSQSLDIVFVQERTTSDSGWTSPLSVAGYTEAIWRENAPSPHQGDGSAIWYKNSTITIIGTPYQTDLSTGFVGHDGFTDVDKSAVGVKFRKGFTEAYAFGTHLCWSLCNDSSGTTASTKRVSQINALLSWVNGIVGSNPNVIIGGDMNFAPDTAGMKSLFIDAGYIDTWNAGLTAGTATANWGDRDGDGQADMPLGDLTTRTHDTRRIDYFFVRATNRVFTLNSINLPDIRATCPNLPLTTQGDLFPACTGTGGVTQQIDRPEDFGPKPTDHNILVLTMNLSAATPSLSCPSTAYTGETIVCDGSASTGVNGQSGWSTQTFTDGRAPVDMNFGDAQGSYSHAVLLKAPHVYQSAGTYTVTLGVKDSAGLEVFTTASITVSDIPAATGANIVTLTDQGNNTDNCAALQAAINTASGANTVEREIRLPAITYTCALTTPTVVGTKIVTLMPSNTSWLPNPLTRVTPALSSNMPKLKSPGADQTPLSVPAGSNRGYFRLLGIEVLQQAGTHIYNLMEVGSGATTYAQLPTNVIVDRCYLHGNPTDPTGRGIFANANGLTLMNSYLAHLHDSGADAQAIAGFAGSKIGIVNNFLEGYGENVMFGGADASIKFSATCVSGASPTGCVLNSAANLRVGDGISFMVSANRGPWSASIVRSIASNTITFDQITNSAGTPTAPDTTSNAVKFGASPQDIFIARNYLFKSLTFRVADPSYAGTFAVIKNSFELKHAMRVVFDGNVIENMWGNQGQSGPTVLFSPRNQTCYLVTFPHDPVTCPEQTNPWTMVRDVQFTNTHLKNISDFVNVIGTDNLNPPGTGDESGPSSFVQYIFVSNNLVEKLDPDALEGSAGSVLWIFPGARHFTMTHQTALNISGGSPVGTEAAPIGSTSLDVKLVNNIFEYRDFGFIGGGQGNDFIDAFWPDGFITHNVMSDEMSAVTPGDWLAPQAGPNYFPATINTNTFINMGAGNYRLNPSSPYKAGNATPAADGTDIGVNFDTIVAATLNTETGNWSGTTITSGGGSRGKGRITRRGKAVIK